MIPVKLRQQIALASILAANALTRSGVVKPHPTGHGSRKLWPVGGKWRGAQEPSPPFDNSRAGRRRQWKEDARGSAGLDRKGGVIYTKPSAPIPWNPLLYGY